MWKYIENIKKENIREICKYVHNVTLKILLIIAILKYIPINLIIYSIWKSIYKIKEIIGEILVKPERDIEIMIEEKKEEYEIEKEKEEKIYKKYKVQSKEELLDVILTKEIESDYSNTYVYYARIALLGALMWPIMIISYKIYTDWGMLNAILWNDLGTDLLITDWNNIPNADEFFKEMYRANVLMRRYEFKNVRCTGLAPADYLLYVFLNNKLFEVMNICIGKGDKYNYSIALDLYSLMNYHVEYMYSDRSIESFLETKKVMTTEPQCMNYSIFQQVYWFCNEYHERQGWPLIKLDRLYMDLSIYKGMEIYHNAGDSISTTMIFEDLIRITENWTPLGPNY